jgi:hypothetical protein
MAGGGGLLHVHADLMRDLIALAQLAHLRRRRAELAQRAGRLHVLEQTAKVLQILECTANRNLVPTRLLEALLQPQRCQA